ncbi:hypothetical protein EAI_01480, partial [Harpegnathos saltator]
NVYATKPADLADLRERIPNLILPKMRRKVLKEFHLRLGHCQVADGRQFEHLI